MEVKINKEIRNYSENIFFGNTEPNIDKNAKSKALWVVDSDDVSTEEEVENIINRLKANPQLSDAYKKYKYTVNQGSLFDKWLYVDSGKLGQRPTNNAQHRLYLNVERPYIENMLLLLITEADKRNINKCYSIDGENGTIPQLILLPAAKKRSFFGRVVSGVENIFKEMQAVCEKTFDQKEHETAADGTVTVRGSRAFIEEMEKALGAKLAQEKQIDSIETA